MERGLFNRTSQFVQDGEVQKHAVQFLVQDVEDRISMLFLASYPFWVVARWGIGFPVLTGVACASLCRCKSSLPGALSMEQWRKKVLNPPVKAKEPNRRHQIYKKPAARRVCYLCPPPWLLGLERGGFGYFAMAVWMSFGPALWHLEVDVCDCSWLLHGCCVGTSSRLQNAFLAMEMPCS